MTNSRKLSAAGSIVRIYLVFAAILLVGCGGGGLFLTGGSVPAGTSRLAGKVIRADDPGRTVSNASVKLSIGGNSSILMTGLKGEMDFGSIQSGVYLCEITPPAGTALGSGWAWPFELPDHSNSFLTAALWPETFNPTTISSLTISPANVALRAGTTTKLSIVMLDQNGSVISLSPSLLVNGDAGTIDPDGTFHAIQPGKAVVNVWMPGYFAKSTIVVTP